MPIKHQDRLMNLVLDLIELHFSNEELVQWLSPFMNLVCKNVSEISQLQEQIYLIEDREYHLSYVRVVALIVARPTMLYGWLCSETFFDDLEYLYFLMMPST